MHPVISVEAQWQSAEARFLSFFFILHAASLSHPLPIVWWPSVTASYSGFPYMSAPSRQSLVSHPEMWKPFFSPNKNYLSSVSSLLRWPVHKHQEHWPGQLVEHQEVQDYLWDLRAQGCSRLGEGGLAQPSSQLALLAVCYCQLPIMYWSGI